MKNLLIKVFVFASIFASTANATESLTATIIGSGSPHYNENRASASVLISAANTHVLVDMGNGTQANLSQLGTEVRDLSALLFTHHHLDHNEEFVPIFIRSLMGRHNFTIVGPPNTVKLSEAYLDLYAQDIAYRLAKTKRSISDREKAFTVRDINGGESFKIDDIQVSTLKVPHTIHTVAYRFDYKGQSIVITGDLTYAEQLPEFAKHADYMIIDSGGMVMIDGRAAKKKTNHKGVGKGKTRAHLDVHDSSTLAQKSRVKNLVYTHFNPGTVDTQASLEMIRENYQGVVIFAEDLMIVNSLSSTSQVNSGYRYPIVDTGQQKTYSNNKLISLPDNGERFFGQDANYIINKPSYSDNNDGTISDNVTGLMWQKEMAEKLTFAQALQQAKSFNLAGYNDWRIANIKELYSLIQFSGSVKGQKALYPFIDTNYFNQPLGDTGAGEREIDAQTWSSTEYVGKTMGKDETVFGVNFVDGRIKGYPKYNPRTKDANKMYFRFVRGNSEYGKNSFVDNGDGTISDRATGLMWQQSDSGEGMNWQSALQYSQNLTLAGHDDWRLPTAKELQSLVDYQRSPETTHSPAIDPIFYTSQINNEAGEADYPYFWSSTTHLDGPVPESGAVYIAFGKALGEMRGKTMDVHGAGSQRSDPKTGLPMSRGPQGDMIRVDNYVRSVRGGAVTLATGNEIEKAFTYLVADSENRDVTQNKSAKSSPVARTAHNKFIHRFDKNGDGKVSASEFKGETKRFNHFDKNRDGYISADEAPTGPPKNKK